MPSALYWKIFIEYLRRYDKLPKVDESSSFSKICQSVDAIDANIDFSVNPLSDPPSRKFKLSRFPENPTKNWGPLSKAK